MLLCCLHCFSRQVWHSPMPLLQQLLLTWPGSPLCMDFRMWHSGMTHWSKIRACLQASFLSARNCCPVTLPSWCYMTREATTGCANMSSVPVQWWIVKFFKLSLASWLSYPMVTVANTIACNVHTSVLCNCQECLLCFIAAFNTMTARSYQTISILLFM